MKPTKCYTFDLAKVSAVGECIQCGNEFSQSKDCCGGELIGPLFNREAKSSLAFLLWDVGVEITSFPDISHSEELLSSERFQMKICFVQ